MQRYDWNSEDGYMDRYDDGLFVLNSDAQAEIDRLTAERDAALKALCEAATARGQAEGKLAASEMAGVVEGWKTRAEKAEAERDKLAAQYTNACKIIDKLATERDQAQAMLADAYGAHVEASDLFRERMKPYLAAVQIHMRERAAVKCFADKGRFDTPDRIRALSIDPDEQKALDRILARTREDAIREMKMPVSFISTWHKVTEWCEKEGETVSAQTAWGEVKQAILALLNNGGRDER